LVPEFFEYRRFVVDGLYEQLRGGRCGRRNHRLTAAYNTTYNASAYDTAAYAASTHNASADNAGAGMDNLQHCRLLQ